MNRFLTVLCLPLAFATIVNAEDDPFAEAKSELMQRASFAYGTHLAQDLLDAGVQLDPAHFSEAFAAVVNGEEPLMDEDSMAQTFAELRDYLGNRIKWDSEQFLAANSARQGVEVTASGLQYKVLQKGEGTAKPGPSDSVEVHYTGKLVDGTVFDSSRERGEPISFPLSGVIKGWTEGLQLMAVGDRFEFSIPASLGYGDTGSPPAVPGDATLIFDVELLGINP